MIGSNDTAFIVKKQPWGPLVWMTAKEALDKLIIREVPFSLKNAPGDPVRHLVYLSPQQERPIRGYRT